MEENITLETNSTMPSDNKVSNVRSGWWPDQMVWNFNIGPSPCLASARQIRISAIHSWGRLCSRCRYGTL